MNIERSLTETFTAHEHLTPPADQVMLAVQHQTNSRPRAASWALIGTAAAAVVAVAAASTWGVAALRGHPSGTPLAQRPAIVASTAAAHPTVAPKPAAKAITALTMPFDLGWLPAGAVHYTARRINIGGASMSSLPAFDGEYLLTVQTKTGKLMVDVQQMPGNLADAHFKSGPGSPISINGRPGIESANSAGPGGYELYFADAGGGLMYVNVALNNGIPGPADALRSMGRQVGRTIRFPGTTKVNPTFGLGYLPAGLRMCAFDVEDLDGQFGLTASGFATAYSVGTSASQDAASTVNIGTNLAVKPTGTAGRTVQGRPTRQVTDSGYNTLYILRAVGSEPLSVASRLPLSELYKIADGLVLPAGH